MKYPAIFLAALMILLLPFTADRAQARKHEQLTIKQIMANSSRAKALAANLSVMRASPTPKQLKVLTQRADKLRMILRRPVQSTSGDAAWASLIAPVNRCTDLVRKVCGVEKQCASSSSCALAVQILDLYNSEPNAEEKYSIEGNCIVSLVDDAIFPTCQP